MAAVDIENIDFDVEISEKSDQDIVLANRDESLEIVMTEGDVNTEEYENLSEHQRFNSDLIYTLFMSKITQFFQFFSVFSLLMRILVFLVQRIFDCQLPNCEQFSELLLSDFKERNQCSVATH